MHVGLGLIFQNLGRRVPDAAIYSSELSLAANAESAGFDSIWTPEHHFTDYMLTPNVVQFLSWVAGKTSRIGLGTMVTVLPWQDPIRVTENFALLDHLSSGRALLGIGRGLGRVEFEGFAVKMSESRTRFREFSSAILTALETGVMEYDGAFLKQKRVEIRPLPPKTFKGRVFASAISPESFDTMAKLGVGLMVIAQKPWDKVVADLEGYKKRYLDINGEPAQKPILAVFVATSDSAEKANEMRRTYLQNYARSTVEHYEFNNIGLAEIPGYEYYGGLARNIAKHGVEQFSGFLADLQVWGTPDVVIEKLNRMVTLTGAGSLILLPSFGGMSAREARENFDLVTSKVLPALRKRDVGGDIGVRYEDQGAEDRMKTFSAG